MVIRGVHRNAAVYDTPTVCTSSLNPPPSLHSVSLASYLHCLPNCGPLPACEFLEAMGFVLFMLAFPESSDWAGTNMGLGNIWWMNKHAV